MAAVYMMLFDSDDRLFSVRNTAGELGVPGGKVELMDETLLDALHREFKEETGQDLPADLDLSSFVRYKSASSDRVITVYYTTLADGGGLVDAAVEGDEEEVEALWVPWRDRLDEYREHTRRDLKLMH
jgi:ADP-ribose pyrophosphatase YjhB (NUDIX family)